MPHFKLAHVKEQGQNMLIFPLESGIHNRPDREKVDILDELEMRANVAGLAGSAVIFWQHGRHTHFMGPRPWHPFLRSLTLQQVYANLSSEISW